MADDWYRLPDWDVEARIEFERRLGRARSYSRAQYLRIKGLALEEVGEVEGARELWRRVLADDGEFSQIEGWSASEHLGDSYAAEDPAAAIAFYRRSMRGNRHLTCTTATQHIKIAELLIARGSTADLDAAAKLLKRWPAEADFPFPSAHFRWNLAVIDHAEAVGDRDGARQAAIRALDLAGRGPAFPHQKTVGVVDADRRTLKRLQHLATKRFRSDIPL